MNFAEMTVAGNVAADATLTPNTHTDPKKNNARCSFTVVVNEDYGDKKAHTNFPVVVWGKYAESIAKFLKTGKQVLVAGRPTLFEVGHLLEKPERRIRSFSLRARLVKLGNDSQKNRTQASGAIIDPGMLAVLQVMGAKNGMSAEDIAAIMNASKGTQPVQPAVQQAQAAAAPVIEDEGADVPFGE